MTDNEKNFIDSKDSFKYGLIASLVFQGIITVFCILGILFYVFKVSDNWFLGTFFGFILSSIIMVIALLNLIARICLRRKYKYAYYGVCFVLISVHLTYFITKTALYPFSQNLGFFAIGLWIVSSAYMIYGIKFNIKRDSYNDESEDIYFFENQDDKISYKKYGIVISKHTIINAAIYVLYGIELIVVRCVMNRHFTGETIKQKILNVVLIPFGLGLCWAANFGWKLIVKQVYVYKCKYDTNESEAYLL